MTATVTPHREASTSEPGSARRPQSTLKKTPVPYFLVLPAVALLVLFVIAPAVYALLLSFQARKVVGGLLGAGSKIVFTGLDNYASVFGDGELWSSLLRMLLVGVIVVPLTVGLALLFALLLDIPRTRLKRFTRLAIFLPYAVPGVIASLMWGFLYLPATSPIGGDHFDFFGATTVFFSVANIAVWGAAGFTMIVVFTALRALPPEIYEAAKIDGCSEFQIAWRIKIPLLRPALVMCGMFTVLAALQLFNEPNTLRPLSNAISSTWVPLMKIYNDAFVDSDIYRAAATSVVFALATVVVSVAGARVVRARATKGAK
ncbi:MAG: binding-protein-dependent transporter inner rane component [Amycolatopsis sp.]|jgi:multiple sugar transport system permease protein|uniref:carbohydrate ABC transporter permease n=1 Tax=Amycolatopsis sp. TaxID=37632 RepID=UPI002631F136|nr:sugar ABC transporter permease [Amycolatopsis sp.]MCU1679889.1 binding-protein-dependent transporter inner rane component [Amycolatopsis sp.]